MTKIFVDNPAKFIAAIQGCYIFPKNLICRLPTKEEIEEFGDEEAVYFFADDENPDNVDFHYQYVVPFAEGWNAHADSLLSAQS